MMRGYLSVVLLSCCAASAFEQSYDPTETLIVISKPRRRESVFATLPFANRSQGGGAKHLSAESSQGAWRCNDNGEWLGEGDGCRCWEGWEGAACEKSICGLHGTPLSLVCGLGALEACRARFPGRLVTELCVCGAGWEGSRCQLPRCHYGRRRRKGNGCVCLGNYAPPHCQSCRPGFYGIDCSFRRPDNASLEATSQSSPPTSSALAMGFAMVFLAMLCLALGLLFRCATLLCSCAWLSCLPCCPSSPSQGPDSSQSRPFLPRSPPPPLPRWGQRVWGGSWCSSLGLRFPSFPPGTASSDPPSYQTSLLHATPPPPRLPPPPPYQDAVQIVAVDKSATASPEQIKLL